MRRFVAVALAGPVIAVALACLLWAGAESRASPASTAPAAVLVDHQAPAHVWTTREAAEAEFAVIERNLGASRPGFAYHEKFLLGHAAMTTYQVVDGQLAIDMYLRPVYQSEASARAVAGHELGHVYAIWYRGDTSEAAADVILACFGSPDARPWATVAPADCGAVRGLYAEKEGAP